MNRENDPERIKRVAEKALQQLGYRPLDGFSAYGGVELCFAVLRVLYLHYLAEKAEHVLS